MAKYIQQVAGTLTEIVPISATTGLTDASKVVQTDATGKLDKSLMPVGIAPDTFSVLASEDLLAGDFVHIYDNAGTANVRKADATLPGKHAMGYVTVGVTTGSNAQVYFEGMNSNQVGLTIGKVYLATTAGLATNTVPTTAGQILQVLGNAFNATQVNLELGEPITLA